MHIRFSHFVAAVTIFLGSATGTTLAGMIDQEYLPITGQGYNTASTGNLPIGQEFTPTLGSLDFVDLFIGDAGSDIGPGARFEINIRDGSIGGAILGTSNQVLVPDGTNTGVGLYEDFVVTRFLFNAPVVVTPGQVAVIEVVQLAPTALNFLLYGGPDRNSTYAGGRAIVGGVPQTSFDFAFREGLLAAAVPEPSSIVMAGMGVLALGGLALRRRTQVNA